MLMGEMIWAQVFGALAAAVFIASVQFKKKTNILIALVINTILAAIGLALLGAWSGLTTNLVTLLPAIFVYYYDKKHEKGNPAMAVPFLVMLIVVWGCVASNFYDILALIGSSAYVFSLFQKQENTIRKLLIFNQLAWVAYNLVVGMYSGALFGLGFIVSDSVALVRFRKDSPPKRPIQHHHKRRIFG